MSEFSVVQAISVELRRQILTVLDATPGADFGLGGDIRKISLLSPAADLPDATVISLYLCHMEIDGNLRNQRMLADAASDAQYRHPPLPLKLRFLLTPVGADEETNQLVLGRLIQHFYDNPNVTMLAGQTLGDSFGGADSRLRITLDMPPVERMTALWTALASTFRLAILLEVEIVAVDSGKVPMQMPRVEQLTSAYGQIARRAR